MKTPQEWRKHLKVCPEEWASDKEVKAIQADALAYAIEQVARAHGQSLKQLEFADRQISIKIRELEK